MTMASPAYHFRTLGAAVERLPGTARGDPARQAYEILRWGFTIAPIIAGADKFFHLLADWHKYLAPAIARLVPGDPHLLMYAVGVIEMIAGVIVFFRPRVGGYLVAAWLLGIIGNLLLHGAYYDIALRDLGLAVGALALARLATEYEE
jgi:hypothetical protein